MSLLPTRRRSNVSGCCRNARCRDGDEQHQLGDTLCAVRDPDGPQRRPPARAAAAKVKWGWDAAAPPVPPLRARGAQGWPRPRGGGRAATCAVCPASARRAPGPVGPCPLFVLRSNPRSLGKRGRAGQRSRSRAARFARSRGGHGETRLERFSARFLEATPRPGPAARPGARSPGCSHRRQRAGERQRLCRGPVGPAGPGQGCHPLPPPPPGTGAASAKSCPAKGCL